MITVIEKTPMGQRFSAIGRGLKKAFAGICVIKHEGGSFTYGIGILYPDIEHLYFAPHHTRDPRKLWQALYAATKISCISDEILATVIAITDETISISDPRFTKAEKCLAYGYDAEKLRKEVLRQEPPHETIRNIIREFNVLRAPIDNPFGHVTKTQKHTRSFDPYRGQLTPMTT